MNLQWDHLPELFPAFPSPERWLPLLARHLAIVESARERARSTSVRPEDAIRRNYAESLEILRIAEECNGSPFAAIADVGSGGGYPGIVIAVVRPDSTVHLIEPLQKRARLLQEMAAGSLSDAGWRSAEVPSQTSAEASTICQALLVYATPP